MSLYFFAFEHIHNTVGLLYLCWDFNLFLFSMLLIYWSLIALIILYHQEMERIFLHVRVSAKTTLVHHLGQKIGSHVRYIVFGSMLYSRGYKAHSNVKFGNQHSTRSLCKLDIETSISGHSTAFLFKPQLFHLVHTFISERMMD